MQSEDKVSQETVSVRLESSEQYAQGLIKGYRQGINYITQLLMLFVLCGFIIRTLWLYAESTE